MDPDMNKYDLEHVTTDHPEDVARGMARAPIICAWRTYYTPEHVKTVIRRAAASRMRSDMVMYLMVWFWGSKELWNIYPLETGIIRRKVRARSQAGPSDRERLDFLSALYRRPRDGPSEDGAAFWKMFWVERAIRRDPKSRDYMDTALTPTTTEEFDDLEMFQVTDSARAAGAKARRLAVGAQAREAAQAPLGAA